MSLKAKMPEITAGYQQEFGERSLIRKKMKEYLLCSVKLTER